ncbi:MAG: hypothetical protein HY342_02220 [Candidatus Lambdaproteobacteria bacterium]|nr:hypothetical protein [Candidatus Lambdaproteobacteria bacterium]
MQAAQQESLPPHRVLARNYISDSENKIHSNDVAQRYGFSGALIGGVYVYGYMVHALVERYGEEWLAHAVTEVTFFKPAYDGDRLSIEAAPPQGATGQRAHRLLARNAQGVELARLDTHLPAVLPSVDSRAAMSPAPPGGARRPVAWDDVVPGRPLRALQWRPSATDNAEWAERCEDRLPIFRAGARPPLHPGLTLQAANRVFKEHYILNAWIHVSSHITQHALLRAGDAIEVRAVPVRTWRHKGHEFAELYVALLADGLCAQEVLHQVIFTIRPKADPA